MTNKSKMDLTPFSPMEDSVYIARDQLVQNVYTVSIDEEIEDQSNYRNLLALLATASPDDVVIIRLSSPGGHINTAVAIYNAILSCEAHTIAVLDIYAASAATFFLLATDEVRIQPNSWIMVHGASYGTGFQGMEGVKTFVDFFDDYLNKLILEVYEGFMSEEEITDMIKHQKDIFMTADEVVERLNNRALFRQNKEEELQKQFNKTIEEAKTTKPKATRKSAGRAKQ